MTKNILESAENDLTQAVYETLKQPRTRKELRPVLQEVVNQDEALELLQAYVTHSLPWYKSQPMANEILTAVLRWIRWEDLLYQLVELYELKDEWALAMLP